MSRSSPLEQRRRRSISDPLTAALLPPPNETIAEKEQRLKKEYDAKRISDGIDEMIHQERLEKKKTRAEVHVLLLGQSESGKSTTLKQFQLLHQPSAFHAERIAWRAVIYLNLVRSVRRILEALAPDTDALDDDGIVPSSLSEVANVIISSNGRPDSAISGTKVPNYELYRQRLEPLGPLEEKLTRLLSNPDDDEPTHLGPVPSSWDPLSGEARQNVFVITGTATAINGSQNGSAFGGQSIHSRPTITIPTRQGVHVGGNSSGTSPSNSSLSSSWKNKHKEVVVHTSTNWKKAFSLGGKARSPKSAHSGEVEGWWEDPEDPVHELNRCAQTMLDLWKDRCVRKRLHEKRLRLEESSGFYLDEIPRITAKKYIPTDSDVLKARLKTVGVVEHTFYINSGHNRGVEWKIYDVGGARNQRQAWAPYFEDVTAIIFLAPISAFDQVLTEDPKVNRLEDSILLWKSLVSNKLLANVNVVLFLNKVDLLQAKLKSGVRLNRHMTSYADRGNDYESVTKYFQHKFSGLHQTYTPNKDRELYIHLTAVTDTQRTQKIISTVRDIIIKQNLRNMKLV